MHFRGDADGVHLVGDWDGETSFDPYLLTFGAVHRIVRTTIKIQTVEGWALYRLTGAGPSGTLHAKRIRRGRTGRLSKSDKS